MTNINSQWSDVSLLYEKAYFIPLIRYPEGYLGGIKVTGHEEDWTIGIMVGQKSPIISLGFPAPWVNKIEWHYDFLQKVQKKYDFRFVSFKWVQDNFRLPVDGCDDVDDLQHPIIEIFNKFFDSFRIQPLGWAKSRKIRVFNTGEFLDFLGEIITRINPEIYNLPYEVSNLWYTTTFFNSFDDDWALQFSFCNIEWYGVSVEIIPMAPAVEKLKKHGGHIGFTFHRTPRDRLEEVLLLAVKFLHREDIFDDVLELAHHILKKMP